VVGLGHRTVKTFGGPVLGGAGGLLLGGDGPQHPTWLGFRSQFVNLVGGPWFCHGGGARSVGGAPRAPPRSPRTSTVFWGREAARGRGQGAGGAGRRGPEEGRTGSRQVGTAGSKGRKLSWTFWIVFFMFTPRLRCFLTKGRMFGDVLNQGDLWGPGLVG